MAQAIQAGVGENRSWLISGRAHRVEVELITNRQRLELLEREWNALLSDSRADTIFLTWEWISAWLDTLAADIQPAVLVARDASASLCGIAPFYRTKFTLAKLIRHRWLRVLGDADSGSEYGNIITRYDAEQEATQAILHYLRRQRRLWDALWLPNMGPSGDPWKRLEAAAGEAGLLVRSRGTEFARINLPDSFAAYLRSLPRKIRYQMRRGVERVEGDFAAVLVSCERGDQLDRFLDDLFRLHQARWNELGEPGSFSKPQKRAFYRAFSRRMLNRGWLRLDALHVDGRAVAGQIGFAYQGAFYELQRGLDTGLPNVPAGWGAALRCMVVRRCVEEGIATYDFLGGYSNDKRRAGAERACGRDLLLVRPSLRNDVLFKSNAWPTGRYLREKRPGVAS